MALSEKLLKALQSGIVLNERVLALAQRIERLDDDVRQIDRRLVRIETFVEVAEKQKQLTS
ncbi:MAG TPA: hypothetical protein ENJ19_01355 [Gammaproteobacteria bacterium]|nr:hypothetical protein [Gammaproteobacteria bacterium]